MGDGMKFYFPTGLLVLYYRGSPVREHDPVAIYWPRTLQNLWRRKFMMQASKD